MNEFFNWNDSWFVISGNWLWLAVAFGLGIWVGWRTNTPDEV